MAISHNSEQKQTKKATNKCATGETIITKTQHEQIAVTMFSESKLKVVLLRYKMPIPHTCECQRICIKGTHMTSRENDEFLFRQKKSPIGRHTRG
jgi:hypothetical protein